MSGGQPVGITSYFGVEEKLRNLTKDGCESVVETLDSL